MVIVKKNGQEESFAPQKVLNRIKKSAEGLNIDCDVLAQAVISQIKDKMTTNEVDELIISESLSKITTNNDYSFFASNIAMSRDFRTTRKNKFDFDISKKVDFDYLAYATFKKSYQQKGETPQEMYGRIANYFGEDVDEKQELFDMLVTKQLNFATPTTLNAGTGSETFISCFKEGTLVNTLNGLKPIEEIKKGELVLTHNNRYKEVKATHKNKVGDRNIKKVKVYRTNEIICTDNHEFLSYTTETERLGASPEFIPVKYLRVGDYVKGALDKSDKLSYFTIDLADYKEIFLKNWDNYKATKNTKVFNIKLEVSEEYVELQAYYENTKGKVSKFGKNNKLKRFIKVDGNFAKFLGLYLGDGHVQRSKSGYSGIGITESYNSKKVDEFVENFIRDYFGLDVKTYLQVSGDRSWKKIMINSKMFAVLIDHIAGKHFDKKRIPSFAYNMDKQFIDNLIAGLVSSDGTVTKKGEIRITMANADLIKSLHNLCRIHNHPVGISKTKVSDKAYNKAQMYRVDFGNNPELLKLVSKDYADDRCESTNVNINKTNIKLVNNEYYFRINDIQTVEEDIDYVYDITVGEDHSYCVEGIVVHNCDISMLEEDSLEGIQSSLSEMARASKNGAGIGIYIGNIRSSKSKVGEAGFASGVVRLADMIQATLRFYNQKGRRPGSAALYLPMYHKDIISFLELRLNEGDERLRTRDIFTGVVINDFFMDALTNDKDFYLFCPYDLEKNKIKLHEAVGEEATKLYNKAVELGIGEKVNPKDIWIKMIASQVSTGTPYTIFIDNINKYNMMQHFGTIKSLNLCVETALFASKNETGQCALGSIPLPYCKDIKKASEILSYNINKVIDRNIYPTQKAVLGGFNQRTIGIGVAGLAEYLYNKGLHFEHPDAPAELRKITKLMYEGAIKGSQRYHEKYGKQFLDYKNSDYATWNLHPCKFGIDIKDLDIDTSKPVCNTLFVALMPTASSSNLLSCTEAFEVPQAMVYKRKTDKGEFTIVQNSLVEDLKKEGLWNEELANMIVQAEGSIQNIKFIPQKIRDKYKTAFEVSQKRRLDMIIEASPFIDQSYSLNMYYPSGDFTKISSGLIYAWKNGLKTGSYYTRVRKKKEGTSNLFQRTESIEKPKDSLFNCEGCSA